MSVYVSAWVWRYSRSKGSTRLVLLALADIADDDGHVPPQRDASLKRLSDKTQLAERTVRYCLRELEGQSEEGRPGLNPPELATQAGNGRFPSRYQILMTQLEFQIGPQREEHDLPAEVVGKPVGKSKREGHARAGQGGTLVPPRGAPDDPERGTPVPPVSRIDVKARDGRKGDPPQKSVDKNEQKKPYTPSADVVAWAAERNYTPYLHLHVEHFRNYIAEPKVRQRYTDLNSAFRNAVLSDWGNVRAQAQRAAREGRGADLERWWTSADGMKAKGLALGLPAFKAGAAPSEEWLRYQIDVLDAAVDADGWGAWVDQERQGQNYGWVCARREASGKDYPGMQIDAVAA